MKRLTAAIVIFVAAIAVAGCSSSTGNAPDVGPTDSTAGNGNPAGGSAAPAAPAATAALFQPAQGIFPFPNDLYFSGTLDGTINIQPANGLIPNQTGLNALDGWSTTAPIRIRFGGALDPSSFSAANIRVYQVQISNQNKSVTGFTRPLTYGTEFSANIAADTGVGNQILEITPLVPLVPSTGTSQATPGVGYLVLLTDGIRMAGGAAATADRDYATIKTTLGTSLSPASATKCNALPNTPMQGACGLTLSHLLVAANPALGPLALNPANIIVSFHFSTQATQDTLRILGQMIAAGPAGAIGVAPTVRRLDQLNPQLPPIADARFGTVTVPYYSFIPTAQSTGGISTDNRVLSKPWEAAVTAGGEKNLTRFNPVPAKVADKAIPLIVTVPNANAGAAGTKPGAGWPVVIFQHGITRDRSDALAIAGAMAQAGWAVVAVDLPLHGITNTTSPLYQPTNEQTFNLDLVLNATGAVGQDSIIDTSGTHFINLTFPLTSRDALRQGVVNQLALLRALPSLDVDGDTMGDFDGSRVAFVGQSLGSITGITFGAVIANPALVPRMTFSVPGGGVAALLRDSATFGPRINAGLQGQGLLPGTTLYAQFFRDTQAIVDAGDPLNYVASTAAARTIYFQQVVGANPTPPLPDQVIPNSATQRLITAVQAAVGAANFPRVALGSQRAGSGYVNFVAGDHGSLLSPAANADATKEMQTETVIFTAGYPIGPIPPGTIVGGASTPTPPATTPPVQP
ncbi:MAG TPA: hypothetical protein VMF52_18205 [Steroidobacteraceae bacterium]|nr:hypothetical protein [Steroidobacteraceae bacterium]